MYISGSTRVKLNVTYCYLQLNALALLAVWRQLHCRVMGWISR